jgi:hypothetical protein
MDRSWLFYTSTKSKITTGSKIPSPPDFRTSNVLWAIIVTGSHCQRNKWQWWPFRKTKKKREKGEHRTIRPPPHLAAGQVSPLALPITRI